jgi:hypothetical protein
MIKIIAFLDQEFPELDELKNDYYNLEIIMSTDKSDLISEYGIKVYPTFLFYYEGNIFLKLEFTSYEFTTEYIKKVVESMVNDMEEQKRILTNEEN